MAIFRVLAASTALIATTNIGGTAEHIGLYSYAAARYGFESVTGNRGQANLNWALTFQAICGQLSGSNDDPKQQRGNQTACHSACSRPEHYFEPNDDEPEL